MKTRILLLTLLCLSPARTFAQSDIPLLRPEERLAVDSQTDAFNQALQPTLKQAALSTVRVWAGNRRLAYGTVVTDGRHILSKLSEITRARAPLTIDSGSGTARPAQVVGIYSEDDLALLSIDGPPLPAVQWSTSTPALGSFLAAPQPNGQPAAFGVVSVLERNLRDTDQAYLGIIGTMEFTGPGVKIQEVAPDSGAASAGLQPGQIILKVGERTISGLLELKNALIGVSPGSKISLLVDADGRQKQVSIQLGKRPPLPSFTGDRLRQMEQMGGATSRVRDSFRHAIQSDMRPQPNQIGGPVVDLDGNVIGITLARADRTRSFIMPAAAVKNLLESKGASPNLARQSPPPSRRAHPQSASPSPADTPDPNRPRRQISRLQRLRDLLRHEMDTVEPES